MDGLGLICALRRSNFWCNNMGALSDPFDPNQLLWSGCPCGLHASMREHQLGADERVMAGRSAPTPRSRFYNVERVRTAQSSVDPAGSQRATSGDGPAAGREIRLSAMPPAHSATASDEPDWDDQEAVLARCVESAVMKGLFGTDMNRRSFLRAVGAHGACRNLAVHPARQGQGGHRRRQGAAGEEEAQRRLRADHLRDADHHGPPDGLL